MDLAQAWALRHADHCDDHLAVHEALDDKVVDWLEPVTDEQYLAGVRRTEPQGPNSRISRANATRASTRFCLPSERAI